MEKEIKACGLTWETITRQAANREQWRSLVEALCGTKRTESERGGNTGQDIIYTDNRLMFGSATGSFIPG